MERNLPSLRPTKRPRLFWKAELIALITEQCFDDLDARPVRLSSQDIPTPYNGSLENLTIIQPHQIVEAAQQMVRQGV